MILHIWGEEESNIELGYVTILYTHRFNFWGFICTGKSYSICFSLGNIYSFDLLICHTQGITDTWVIKIKFSSIRKLTIIGKNKLKQHFLMFSIIKVLKDAIITCIIFFGCVGGVLCQGILKSILKEV